MQPPKFTTIENLPTEVLSALYVVVAYMANNGSQVLNVELKDLHHDDLELGDYEFSVRKTEG